MTEEAIMKDGGGSQKNEEREREREAKIEEKQKEREKERECITSITYIHLPMRK